MEVASHIAVLDEEGKRLAESVADVSVEERVAACPDWRVRDLLLHVGGVHRWAASFVKSGRTGPATEEEQRLYFAEVPDDELLSWYASSHAALVSALKEASPTLECWTFLPAPSPLAFWARRQAHETAMHRVDAERVSGTFTPFDPQFAADGIDELLTGFIARRRGKLVSDPPVSIGVEATDEERSWTVQITPEGREVAEGISSCDCLLSGPASDLYVLLWNRYDSAPPAVRVSGDAGVLALWRSKAGI
jgi:uncharacterized protein (TIGR03083 family)